MPGQPPVTGEPPTVPPPATLQPPAPIPVIPDVQPVGPPPTIPSAPLRVLPPPTAGFPVTATFQFEPILTLTEEYTDNFNLTKTNKQSNFRTTLSPGLRLGINSPLTKGIIGLTFTPAYDTVTGDLRYFYSLLGQVVWQANPRWQLTVADTFTRSDEPGQADRLGLRQERRTFTTNTFGVNSDYLVGLIATRQSYRLATFSDEASGDTTTHTLGASATIPLYQTNAVSLGYEYLTSSTEAGSAPSTGSPLFGARGGQSDINGHQFTAVATRQLTPLRSVGIKTSYALRNASDETGDSDFQIWNVSLFTRYIVAGRLIVDGSVGVSGLIADSGISVGPNFFSATSISYQFARAVAALAFDSGFSETFADGQNFGVLETQGVTGSLFYPFTPGLSGTVSGFYRRNKPTSIEATTAAQGETTNWGGTLAFSWRLLRGLLLDVSYTYLEQKGSDRTSLAAERGLGNSYTENKVQASFRVSF